MWSTIWLESDEGEGGHVIDCGDISALASEILEIKAAENLQSQTRSEILEKKISVNIQNERNYNTFLYMNRFRNKENIFQNINKCLNKCIG